MTISNLPAIIQPGANKTVQGTVIDNAVGLAGGASINGATITFTLGITSGVANRVQMSATSFTNSGAKGPGGMMICYTV
jgi:hypothetical protein